ncbi:EpsG-like putative glucosyltransferase [Marinomonas alcarazii]|uniref:EpsG-like putative glucosyltransferase n=1 Tax=Marinomonas alcarazii TaxID=491949 RepID=A0A318UWN2_9GAMM|nr:EpsG family protein [Marinomonas alcarazii]PYF79860.1 EpsG-like putative glucosyltransferase [Marinomonas alcarazii]
MGPYFFIFFIVAVLALFHSDRDYRKNRDISAFFVFLTLTLLAGLRTSQVGADYLNYKSIFFEFKGVFDGGLKQVIEGDYFFEPGFAVLIVFIRTFTDSSISFFIMVAFVTSLINFFAVKKVTDFLLLSLLIFFSYDFFTNYMVAIRFGIATSFVFLVIFFLAQKRFIYSFSTICFAMTFHTAAVGMLLPFFMSFLKFKRWYIIVLTLGALVFGYLGLGKIILNSMLPGWVPRADSAEAYSANSQYGNSLGYLGFINVKYLLISVFLFIYWDLLKTRVRFFESICLFLLCAMIIRVGFHDLGFISGRVSALLGVVEIVIIPSAVVFLFKQKLVSFVFVFSYALIHLFFLLYVRGFSEYDFHGVL